MRRRLRRVEVAAVVAVVAVMWGVVEAGPAQAPASPPPNVLIILTDDQRAADTMEIMDRTRRIFDRGGVRYRNAVDTTPQCCPARASIFSGLYAHNHGVTRNGEASNFDPHRSWERYLHDAGYRTAIFGKYLNGWDSTQTPPYFDRYGNPDKDKVLTHRAKRFIADGEASDSTPWALEIATRSPHIPADPPRRFADAKVPRFRPTPAMKETDLSDKDPVIARDQHRLQQIRRVRRGQLRELYAVDLLVSHVFKKLEDTAERGNTLAFFLSDNGYLWGDHGLLGKSLPYVPGVQLPFYIRGPGVPNGQPSGHLVANIDIAPTIFDATGITPGYQPDGRSLLGSDQRDWLLVESPTGARRVRDWKPWNAYLSKRREYIRWKGGFVEDYDLRTDPWQLDASNHPRPAISQKIAQARTCGGSTCP